MLVDLTEKQAQRVISDLKLQQAECFIKSVNKERQQIIDIILMEQLNQARTNFVEFSGG